MKCPKCLKDTFYRLDSDSVDDTGQCKGGCGYSASEEFVAGYWEGFEKGFRIAMSEVQQVQDVDINLDTAKLQDIIEYYRKNKEPELCKECGGAIFGTGRVEMCGYPICECQ